MKQKSSTDPLYFVCGWAFINYGMFVEQQHKLFEIGYPAHPFIFEKRSQVINNICYYHPQILKNEIEYLHRKIYPKQDEKDASEHLKTRYEREFSVRGGKRFKLIVD